MLRWLAVLVALIIATFAGWSLWHQLAGLDVAAVRAALAQVTVTALAAAAGLLGCSYLGYAILERVAGMTVKFPQPMGRSVALAVTTQGISLATGKGLLVAGAVRYRLFNVWSGTLAQALVATMLVSAHGNIGMLLVTGIVVGVAGPWSAWIKLGALSAALVGVGLWVAFGARKTVFSWRTTTVEFPSPGCAVAGALAGAGEKLACALLAWVLIPGDPGIACGQFLAIVLVSLFLARISQVPGGLGVLEATLLGLWPVPLADKQAQVVAGLLAFRVAYFVVPLGPGLLTLAFCGWWRRVPACATASA